ncbi:MAG: ABC transporter substrate-binding protein, partial [Janthinobacterium sp.]
MMFLRKTACAAGLALLTLFTAPGIAATDVAARANKTLHLFLSTSETGLDPAVASDLASLNLMENIFDPLLRYDYLARPVQLQGNTARGLPQVEDGGRTYIFQIQPGVYFTPDPAFKGQPREVTAQDYVYSLTRLYDPALKSPWLFLLEDKLVGDAALKAKFSYDTPIAGLQALDKYTLRIRLN